MAVGLDSCFLIDLYWEDSPRHSAVLEKFNEIAANGQEVCVHYNCFNDFIHVITDSRRFENAFSMEEALAVVDEWRDLENVKILFPDEQSFGRSVAWLTIYKLGRDRLNDTNMAACYLHNGVSSIITANPKDFELFKEIKVIGY